MPDLLLFWGHTPGAAGPGPWCLSQWFPAPFTVGDLRFATAEHYMMWRKARLFDDARVAAAVLEDPDPKRAKEWGREVTGFDGPRWEARRFDAVVDGNLAKFAAHDDLRRYLLDTGDRVLVEASPYDAVWGIGLAADHPDAQRPDRWPGQNLLGLALMRTRELLR
jgi:ribA/ribD-fused uncharacterized protein